MTRSITALLGICLLVTAVGPAAVGPAAAQDVTLTVTVQNWAGGTVQNAELTATWDGGSTTETTASNGQALLDVPEGADVSIAVEHDTYMRNRPYEVDNAQNQNIQIDVSQRGEARVTVTDPSGPVEGATVRFIRDGQVAAEARSGTDGVAETGPIEQDTYDVAVTKPGYLEERFAVGVREDTTRSVNIERSTVQVSVLVQDEHFEDPRSLANATIDIEPIGSSLVTLQNGEASTALPVNRNYRVTVSKPGYDSVERNLPVGEGDTSLTVSISRTPALDATAANRRVVVGETTLVTLTDEYGDPVDDVALTINGTEVGRTDAEGEAAVPVESTGNVTVNATHEGTAASVSVEGVRSGSDGASGNATGTDGGSGPGFGPAVAVLAVALAAGLLARRQ